MKYRNIHEALSKGNNSWELWRNLEPLVFVTELCRCLWEDSKECCQNQILDLDRENKRGKNHPSAASFMSFICPSQPQMETRAAFGSSSPEPIFSIIMF